jgi:CheY-like chemotaxis protein
MHEDTIYKNIYKLLKTVVKETELVATADMACKKIKTTNFNCIIMSLQHPDLPGYKWLISQLKREGVAVPPCILYVPYTMNTRENELSRKYIRDYGVKLAKNTDELLETVVQCLCGQMLEV